jgi:hypothetical protein
MRSARGDAERACQTYTSRTLKVRGGIISQANRYLGGFCSSQEIFPPQIIQLLLTIPPSAARSARCAYAGASLQRSTAAPEALHRSGPLARSGTTRWRAREEQQPNRLTIPRDALPTRLSSFCLLAMDSPPRDTRRNPLISQHTSGIVRGADGRFIDGALAAFLLTACRVERRSDPLPTGYPAGMMAASSRNPTKLSDLLLD